MVAILRLEKGADFDPQNDPQNGVEIANENDLEIGVEKRVETDPPTTDDLALIDEEVA